jgi:hypothetical protein
MADHLSPAQIEDLGDRVQWRIAEMSANRRWSEMGARKQWGLVISIPKSSTGFDGMVVPFTKTESGSFIKVRESVCPEDIVNVCLSMCVTVVMCLKHDHLNNCAARIAETGLTFYPIL